MPRRVPRRRYNLQPGCDAGPPGHRQVAQFGDVPVHTWEVRLAFRVREMVTLDDEARPWERAVIAGMVEMEMAVHDDGDIVGTHPDARETRDDRVIARHDRFDGALRAVCRIRAVDMDGMKTGIKEDDALARPK